MRRRVALIVVTCLLGASLGGCAGVVALGAAEAFSLGVGAADVGASVAKSGKLYTAQMAAFDDVVIAAYRAGDSMQLTVQKENLRHDRAFIRFEDDTGKTGSVRIEKRTPILTYMRIDVGPFGSGPFAKLFLRRVAHELYAAGAYYDDGAHPGFSPGATRPPVESD